MGLVAVVGETVRVRGYVLAGAVVRPADTAAEARAAWAGLPPEVTVVLLTPAAAEAIGPTAPLEGPLTVVMPP